jgi:PTH1 family peptidyl-tRNA hydrolase
MKVVVGLGNPGPRYAHTRHNVGFWVLDHLAERHRWSFAKRAYRSHLAAGRLGDEDVLLMKPQTFMNVSGEAVDEARRDLGVDAADFVVVYDDLDLELGRVRVKARSGAGGHHGVESVIEHLATREFPRVRLGVGRPAVGEPVEFLLAPPPAAELAVLESAVREAADAAEAVIRDGVVSAMNRYNTRAPSP